MERNARNIRWGYIVTDEDEHRALESEILASRANKDWIKL